MSVTGRAKRSTIWLATFTRAAVTRAMATSTAARPPFPPFDEESAKKKVKMAEAAWNTKDPAKVSLAYTPGSWWRNREEFFTGREKIVEFLTRKWEKELDYKLEKQLWCYQGNRIGVTFRYEYRNADDKWYRAYGNEMWEFDDEGLMRRREASINDVAIEEADREFK